MFVNINQVFYQIYSGGLIIMLKKANSEQSYSSLQARRIINKKVEQGKSMIVNEQYSKTTMNNLPNKIQNIPNKIIQKNRHKYLFKKALINTKFQWLNRYLQTSQTASLSLKVKNSYPHYSYLKDKRIKTQLDEDEDANYHKKCKTQVEITDEQYKLKDGIQKWNHQGLNKNLQNEEIHQVFKQIHQNVYENKIKIKKSISNKSRKSALSAVKHQNNQNHPLFLIKDQNKNISATQINTENQNYTKKLKISCPNIKITKCMLENSPILIKVGLKQNQKFLKSTQNCIKNRKKQLIYRSREQRRQHSEFLKRKLIDREQIKVEPWKLQNDDNLDICML